MNLGVAIQNKVWLFGLLIFLVGACTQDKQPSYDKYAKTAKIFSDNCERCHGPEGGGNFLLGKPANANTQLSQKEIADLIMEGRSFDGHEMPAFPQLSRVDALYLAEYVLVLKKRRQGQRPFWENAQLSKKPQK